MRSVVSYFLAGAVVLLVMDVVAPPAGIGLQLDAWPSVNEAAHQTVNRADKRDRLPLPIARKPMSPAQQPQHLLVGCEPAFSPLLAAAHTNFAARCVV